VSTCDVLVIGGINSDYSGQGDKLPAAGETTNGDRFLESPGGKGANQAVTAARLGARVRLIGAVGDDERGHRLTAGLARERVDVSDVAKINGASTGAALIHIEKQILRFQAPATGLTRHM
jgi:ribokinase